MGFNYRLGGWGLLAAQIAGGYLAWRHRNALSSPAEVSTEEVGHVSIVIPARDEASRLPTLLASLGKLRYRDREVVVVDDGSSDGTGAIAREYGVRVVRIEGPGRDWIGKSFACQTGADVTRGEWLLFTDADTKHGRDSLSAALATAIHHDAGLVSFLARQRCETFWEKLLLPYAYALYFVGASGRPVANGQYMLFRRRDYERIGGHASVRLSLIEDVALARQARACGARVFLVHGEEHLEVRMYEDLRSLWDGFAKNAIRFVAVSPRTGIPTVVAGAIMTATLPAALRERSGMLRLLLLVAPAAGLAPWERLFGVPTAFALLYPVAAVVFQAIAVDSIRRSLTQGGTTWKGRKY